MGKLKQPTLEQTLLFTTMILALVLSGLNPEEHFTWALEVSWVFVGLPIIYLTRRSFPLTRLLYYLLAFHALVLILGGYYTYEKIPLGLWVRDLLELSRNHYDRLGHFVQGFVPAILAREIFIRKSPLKSGGWLFLCTTCACLSFSAFFEMIEWWVSLVFDDQATAFLGTQGDVWDTQWDMFLCLVGAIISQLLFAKLHHRQLSMLEGKI